MTEWFIRIDHKLLQFINGTLSNPVFDWLMPIITNQRNWILPLVIILLWLIIFGQKRGRITAVLLLVTVVTTDAIAAQIIKPIVGRIRPSHALLDMINLLVPPGGKFSFVSNHAANSFAMSVIIGYFYQKWKLWLYSLAAVISFSRVYVGVHYPADVIFGGLYGYAMAWIILSFWVILKMRELKRGRRWVWYET